MKSFVIVATKGRAKETYVLLDYLAKQTMPIACTIVVGSEARDVEGLDIHPLVRSGRASIVLSKAGLTIQRNAGLDSLLSATSLQSENDWFVVFFDDDFRPGSEWLERCYNAFSGNKELIGVGGQVLADGVTSDGISEEGALGYLEGDQPAMAHTWSGLNGRIVPSLYGCNMAFRGSFAKVERFDELLPLYGWQEDVDYSVRASRYGRLLYVPECLGVHMGVSGGRTSGVRFGYSQVANILYLLRKGTMPAKKGLLLLARNLASNILRTCLNNNKKDYRGRLYGNFCGFVDLLKGVSHPMRVLDL